eukprot:scaffold3836_cov417-Prasinococcus_capsulatus_cf.AAC.9
MPDGTSGSTGSPSIASLVYDEGSSEHQNDSNARKCVSVELWCLRDFAESPLGVGAQVWGCHTELFGVCLGNRGHDVRSVPLVQVQVLPGHLWLHGTGGFPNSGLHGGIHRAASLAGAGCAPRLPDVWVYPLQLLSRRCSPAVLLALPLLDQARIPCVYRYLYSVLIPEWTSWLLLVMMALYDLVAVLMPGGPLKVIVELAEERQESIPALVYESRPVAQGRAISDAERTESQDQNLETASSSSMDSGSNSCVNEVTRINSGRQTARRRRQRTHEEFEEGSNPDPSASHEATQPGSSPREETPLGPESGSPTGVLREDRFETETGLPDSIKLGLGDFIFYRSADAPPGLLSQGSRSPCLWIVAG